jgi:ERCC4-related helicase
LENDYNTLKKLYEKWLLITTDPKIDKLKKYLNCDLKNKKIIIFTESKETAFYLEDNLKKEY